MFYQYLKTVYTNKGILTQSEFNRGNVGIRHPIIRLTINNKDRPLQVMKKGECFYRITCQTNFRVKTMKK